MLNLAVFMKINPDFKKLLHKNKSFQLKNKSNTGRPKTKGK